METKELIAKWEGISIEEMGAEKTAEKWNSHVKEGGLQEEVSVSPMDAAQTVMQRCADETTLQLLRDQEQMGFPVFNSVYQIEGIVNKRS